MTPVTPHQPLPSHWYISEARGLSLSRSKLVSLEFGRKTRPDGADRALHPSGARPTRRLSPRPRSLLLRRQPAAAAKDDDGLSTAALDEVRSPPEGAGLRHRPPSSPHSNHHRGGYNLRPRRMRTSKYGKKGHAVTSLVLSTTCQSTRARIAKQQKYLMSLCLCIFCLHAWPLSCCDGHGMCMLHHGSCGHFHFGATAVLLQTHRVAYGRDRKRCVACRMGDNMSTSVVTTAVAGWPQSRKKADSRLLQDLRNG